MSSEFVSVFGGKRVARHACQVLIGQNIRIITTIQVFEDSPMFNATAVWECKGSGSGGEEGCLNRICKVRTLHADHELMCRQCDVLNYDRGVRQCILVEHAILESKSYF